MSEGDGVMVRLLVPRRDPDGTIAYRAELHWVRLPLKREDRLAFLERLRGEQNE